MVFTQKQLLAIQNKMIKDKQDERDKKHRLRRQFAEQMNLEYFDAWDRPFYFAIIGIGRIEGQHQHTLTECRAKQLRMVRELNSKSSIIYLDADIYKCAYDTVRGCPEYTEVGRIDLVGAVKYIDTATNRHYKLYETGRITKI